MIRKTFTLLLISLLLASCASLTNQEWTKSTIYTTKPTKIVFRNDTLRTIRNRVKLTFKRKNVPVEIIAVTDSLHKKVTINAIHSFEYWANIPCNVGIGMLVDNLNLKRYAYPKRVYINSSDTINRFFSYEQGNNKGQLLLHLSLPHINSFQLTPENEGTKSNTGFWGVSLGFDYFHSKNQYLNLSASGVTDFFVPIPAAVDIRGEHESMRSVYLSLSNNYKIKRFSVGYGLSYATNAWILSDYGGEDETVTLKEPIRKTNKAFGLILTSYFQTTPNFYIGVIYRPTFIRPDITPTFKYEHLISIDFAWKIRLKK